MAISKISANMIDGSLTSSLVTGSLPAVDGSALTGAGAGIDTETTSDPTAATNPSATGHLWLNKSTGELFICVNATAGKNVWANVGRGEGDVQPYGRPWVGTVSGYQAGGQLSSGYTDSILKYSFTSDANGTDVGNLTHATDGNSCHSSETHGYAATGDHPVSTTIHKWSFASDGNAVAYGGALTGGGWGTSGSYSKTHGYCYGRNNSGPLHDTIDKFNFASEGNATDVGNMTVPGSYHAAASTETYGYCAGGGPGTHDNVIDRVSFSTDGNATDVGDMIGDHGYSAGHQSETHGYVSGGAGPHPYPVINHVQKFQFAASANASDIADLLAAHGDSSGSSSTTHGYSACGRTNFSSNASVTNVIEKFSTTSDANSTDVGDMVISTCIQGGCQY